MTSSSAATRGITFLPVVVAGRDHGVVGTGERGDQRRRGLGQHVVVARVVGQQDLFHAVELGGGFGHPTRVRAGDQHVDGFAQRLGGGERLGGRILQGPWSCSAIKSVVMVHRLGICGDLELGIQRSAASSWYPAATILRGRPPPPSASAPARRPSRP